MDLLHLSCLLLALGLARGGVQVRDAPADPLSRRHCGKELSETLSNVCEGNYNALIKKTDTFYTNFFNTERAAEPGYPFRGRARALGFLEGGGRRRRRGVSKECCEKPCSISELMSYCGQ